MLRVAGFALGVCLCASSVARADAPGDQTQASEDPVKEIEFAALVEKGDRARAAGRNVEAAQAYEAALRKKQNPVIAGRYGLVLMKLGRPDRAAQELHAAFERGQGAPLQERREVSAAYDKAKALTTWVNVDVSQLGATITYDRNLLSRDASFWMFAMPGTHTLRATLDGYEEAVETFTAKPGEELTVTLKLVPLPLPKLPARLSDDESLLLKRKLDFPPHLRTSNIMGDPNYSPQEDPSYGEPKEPKPEKMKTGPRFSVSGGIVTVFGVASWNPAVGGVVGVGLRPHENFSLGLEGRAAWLTTGVANSAISAMTAGGLFSACGHVKWFFACGLGHVGVTNIEFGRESYTGKTYAFIQPGAGGRIGAQLRFTQNLAAIASVDALAFTRGMKVIVENQIVANQPPAMLGAQIIGAWEW